ncbi:MAG: 16S rRNA (cytosine(967)-C(5))-methyltransferase RsmB [Oscillospiraceae bacterium]|nr:16S rRNA (cytosine(967)-C(5))-methyltransferase RsmB [Oscillospiraceae bacterium]
MKKNARFLAVELLEKTFKNNGYSNIQLNSGLENSELDERDKKLCSVLYYGVIERLITLDHIISQLTERPVQKIDSVVMNILRIGIYQILYVDNIPDSASVNESVSLVKLFKKSSASGFVNAVLRKFIRNNKDYAVPRDILISSSIKYSAKTDFVDSLIADYGIEKMDIILSNALETPPITVRLNNLKENPEEVMKNIGAEKIDIIPNCYRLKNGNVKSLEEFKQGYFHVQDLSSQLCCMALNPSENDRVLDLCSAPGGKAFTIAEMMNGKGEIYAFDLHKKRVELIKNGAERLGILNIKTMTGNAMIFNENLPKFSKILCDVPCSGIGVVRRKPEIKYKDFSDFERLPDIQYKILENALNYLETGGELVYSTCTLRKAENDNIVEKLLENHKEIEGVSFLENLGEPFGSYKASVFPNYFNSDGFFISKFRKLR